MNSEIGIQPIEIGMPIRLIDGIHEKTLIVNFLLIFAAIFLIVLFVKYMLSRTFRSAPRLLHSFIASLFPIYLGIVLKPFIMENSSFFEVFLLFSIFLTIPSFILLALIDGVSYFVKRNTIARQPMSKKSMRIGLGVVFVILLPFIVNIAAQSPTINNAITSVTNIHNLSEQDYPKFKEGVIREFNKEGEVSITIQHTLVDENNQEALNKQAISILTDETASRVTFDGRISLFPFTSTKVEDIQTLNAIHNSSIVSSVSWSPPIEAY